MEPDVILQEPLLGSILLVPYFVPEFYEACDGQTLRIAHHSALFNVIGTQFGGDGVEDFNLPKVSGPIENLRYIIAQYGVHPSV